MHVLFVPSWYPKNAGDIAGSFFREQAEALSRGGVLAGVLALTPDPIYAKGHKPQRPLQVSKENGLGVVRGSITFLLPLQRWLDVQLSKRRLYHAWETYVANFGRPDVIHAHSLFPGSYFADVLSKKYGVPFIYTEHRTLGHLLTRSRLSKRVAQEIVRAAHSRHAVSKGHAKHLAERFETPDWEYTPNLLPPSSEVEQELTWSEGEAASHYTFGHMSMLVAWKRADMLLEAFARVHEKDPNVRLVIGGPNPEQAGLLDLAESLGISEVVTFLGLVDRSTVADFYGSIDCFVLPSATETMGVVQVEALAAGVPVISTRTWGGETVIEEGDGLLVDIDDVDGLTEAMFHVKDEPESTSDRLNRRERSVRRFGSKAFVDRYRTVYGAAVAAGR